MEDCESATLLEEGRWWRERTVINTYEKGAQDDRAGQIWGDS